MSYDLNNILREYKLKQTKAIEEARLKKEAIYRELPEVKEIDNEFKKLGIKISMAALDSHVDVNKVRLKIAELNQRKMKLLKSRGYSLDDYDPKYECNICSDTGYTKESKRCECLKKKIVKQLYADSNLEALLEKENFETMRVDIYSDAVDNKEGLSPRENMISNQAIANDYCFRAKRNIYDNQKSKQNLLFFGATGLGKTFLSNCIAKHFLDNGLSVIYLVAFRLFDIISEYRFRNDARRIDLTKEKYDAIFECDLLIIDDLGSEMVNSFTISELYNVINIRIINNKRTIISTNLSFKKLSDVYTDRIFSRIAKHYEHLYFFGEDLRWEKSKWNSLNIKNNDNDSVITNEDMDK